MSSPPPQMKGITVLGCGAGAAVADIAPPSLRDDHLLVRTTAVGLNPTDWKAAASTFGPDPVGCRLGCDYAGVVERAGAAVTKLFAVGGRVAGFVHGANSVCQEDGAFAERIVVKGDLQIAIPDNVSDVEAATLGVGITTVVSLFFYFYSFLSPGPSTRSHPLSVSSRPAVVQERS